MKIENLEQAVEAYKKVAKDRKYDYIVETPTWYVFFNSKDHSLSQPVGVEKVSGMVLGVIPSITIKDYDKRMVAWDGRN